MEFALVLPLVVLLVIGLVEVARISALQVAVIDAARSGARGAAVDPRPEAARDVIGSEMADVVVDTTFHEDGSRRLVTVRVARRVRIIPGIGWSRVDLEGSSTMLVEAAP